MLIHNKIDSSEVNGPGKHNQGRLLIPSREYLAGIFDGEGCITLRKRGDKRQPLNRRILSSGYRSYRLSVKVQMACKPIVEAFVNRYGGTALPTKKRRKGKQLYEWYLSTPKSCLTFLLDIYKLLIEKRSQAEASIPWLRSRAICKRKRYTDSEAIQSEELRLQLKRDKESEYHADSQ